MTSDKHLEHLRQLNAKRAITPRALKQSEKSISDAARLKREQEALSAAELWKRGMEAERRK